MSPLLSHMAWAAAEPVEGKDYTRLQSPVPVAVPGKIEVIEFFGYWCPHCNALEPKLELWAKQLPASVNFRRVPVAWQPNHEPYQRLFFALEALGLGEGIQGKVFQAVHSQGLHLETEAGLTAFAAANSIDKSKLMDAMKGFSVNSKVRIANELFAAYQVDGVPTLVVNGRLVTSPEKAGGDEQALQIVSALMQMEKAKR